ncbi:MAG: coenzyme F420-reducing hydrogenase, FrhD protein [Methanobrevibacter ruminantium]|uniref:coenzyme F420-reducing hydrogenase, FrhD protein n=1 Tax=Methanobrevibacter ruminantium TaxID=83816 RepID=UPI0026EA7A2A|nr:coenzyme F420-reducing hydrogenase, FrhD protein [Methanobrevibacter ruminantium]MCI5736539.1 coenzyme F420-reducing hydrogenase, FrhD protein [Methanobrevibacter ruminantium]MDD6048689.1 coenzyme F420-reducing hydrogenase, FrhD protein [Methanobrevibacter ruminantium]
MPYDAGRLVVGCGNVLFKDDGFGPMVIHALEDYFKENDIKMPQDTQFIDAGTGATHFIFSMPDDNWKKVIVVDVVEWNAEPGTLKIFSPYDMPKGKYENAHTWPVEEPLHDLVDMGIEVVIVGCKPAEITAPDVDMGLTEPVEAAIPKAIEMILNEL